jgi:hypothetical protein
MPPNPNIGQYPKHCMVSNTSVEIRVWRPLGSPQLRGSQERVSLLRPSSSFSRNAAINSQKGTLTLLPPESTRFLPIVSLSYGQTFHVDDPCIGTTAIQGGTIVAKVRSFQLVASKTVAKIEFRLTMAHVTTAQQLARISNDTGLQQDEGPGIVKYLTFTVRHNFAHGFVQGLFSKADARDRITGLPTPEAPRQIWDILATVDQLPFHLVARGASPRQQRRVEEQRNEGALGGRRI